MHGNNSRGNREIHCSPWEDAQAVSGSRKAYADDEQAGEVGGSGSTREVPEQSRETTGGGGDGGKRSGQGELVRAKHPPDTRPGKGAKRAGMGTSSCSQREKAQVHESHASHC